MVQAGHTLLEEEQGGRTLAGVGGVTVDGDYMQCIAAGWEEVVGLQHWMQRIHRLVSMVTGYM